MAEEAKTTPAEEVKKTEPTMAEVVGDTPKEAKGETVGEALKTEPQKEETVPLAAFLEIKKSNKELVKEMKELKKSIEDGAPKKEVNADLKALAAKHNVDEEFLQEFALAVKSQTEAEVEGKLASKLQPLEAKERAAKIDKVFNEHYSKTLETMPEYKDLVKKEVIKSLSLLPENSNKTFPQLLEETYGHLVQGKRGIDPASTRAGKNDSQDVDYKRARNDGDYLKEVLSTPALKEKYNAKMLDDLKKYL